MTLTPRQEQEIDFLCTHFGGTRDDVEEYINATTKGASTVSDKFSGNTLRIAKTKLDRNIKMWRADLDDCLLHPWELEDEYASHPFGKKMIKSVIESTIMWKHYYASPPVALFKWACIMRHRDPETWKLMHTLT